jgi:hypothetical protein
MSSVTSAFAQVDRRIGYFICTADVSGYTDVSASTVDYNSWNANTTFTRFTTGQILEDMGELAKFQGYIFRKVRNVSTPAPGGGVVLPYFWIVVPGGEYPMAGVASASGSFTVAPVARLG